ncbi:hypothetical protein M501DRAFT_941446 [Patellaria atrata CBS 101060]|uniref:Ubiquitin 3 binding protein But2 C-terminal domain-containing protein n=1 Tax=Patellaria atrata CBS 101060 TaxID=1346257 RepID=A0A9P4S3R4_9PEZI|nr:hypothetical protein M501DRAFT_941446 [Patellaria atrata CBS 101060]
MGYHSFTSVSAIPPIVPYPPSSTRSLTVTTLQTLVAPSNYPSPGSNLPFNYSGCAMELSKEFEFPHLILPVDRANPEIAFGSSYITHFSPDVSTLFTFDIPPTFSGKSCSLEFHLPSTEQVNPANLALSGSGGIKVSQLTYPATESMAYNNIPAVDHEVGRIDLVPGHVYQIASFPCNPSSRVGYRVDATGTLDLEYFHHCGHGHLALGLYITES